MATFNKFNVFVEDLAEGKHNLGSDTLTIALTNSAPAAGDASISAITQISYSTLVGGVGTGRNVTASSSAQTSGTYKLVIADKVLTASAAVATFRYIVLYNNTSTTKPLIGYYDYGVGGVTLANAETFTINFQSASGVLTIA